jgi:cation diffusion facilitator CzcD-associated flavoprotein CzcO
MNAEHVDVLIVGAGISGIAGAYYLQTRCPTKSYAILEARESIGGTWDLFRYPGVRSDSDMYTLGFSFRPWPDAKAIADGPAILKYVRETARVYGIDRQIRFNHRVCRAEWSSEDAAWTVEVERGAGETKEKICFSCDFLYMCSGYYDYAKGYLPEWPGVERFTGRFVHPQQWPEHLDYAGKRVVVIGSGATAVTLVPAMAEQAAHVTMLQRSPTYIVARPSEDTTANWLRDHLPGTLGHSAARWKAVLLGMYFYTLMRRKPQESKQAIMRMVRQQLGPDYDVERDFSPRYNPWDQRLCLVPDADLFAAMRAGKASVVTDQIETFTEHGIRLQSGKELEADIIVTATGLVMKVLGGAQMVVDGEPVVPAKTMSYKGMMYSDVPNLASALGYTNASWTLKCELTARYVCRLLNYMDRHGYSYCTPRRNDPTVTEEPLLTFTSGYVQRALPSLPRQGSKRPWKLYQNYVLDLFSLRFGAVDDGAMEFR